MPLSIEELRAHPATATVISLPEPTSKGTASVAKTRGGPINLAYEIYGRGNVKVVWVMGLNAPKIAWHRQIKHFGVDHGDKYSCLVFDNRGAGSSDKPLVRYSTSEMARDLHELLEHVGWVQERQIHLVGVSMGGMISMEFALLAPQLLASLTLQSTAASLNNSVPWFTQLANRIYMFMPKSMKARLENVQKMLFSQAWLTAPDELGVYPTNADRFVAEEIWRQENIEQPVMMGALLQGLAATSHNITGDRLKKLTEVLPAGVPILVVSGDKDKMIEVKHSHELMDVLGDRARLKIWEDVGHVVHWERRTEFNQLVGEYWDEAEKALGRA